MNSLIVKLLQFLINLYKGDGGFEILDATTVKTEGSLQYDTPQSGTMPYDGTVGGPFTNGETITGGTSAATAIVVSKTATVFTLRAISGTFVDNETVTGGTSGATALVNGSATLFTFEVGETITGGTSSATGVIVSVSSTELELDSISGVFQNNEVITASGGSSAASALADGTLKYDDEGTWYKIMADGAADVLIDKIEFSNGNSVETITLLKGDTLSGNIINVRITSGRLIAWKSLSAPAQ